MALYMLWFNGVVLLVTGMLNSILLSYAEKQVKYTGGPRVEMLFSAPHVLLALRWVPPTFAIVGSSATYITIWAVLRGARWPLSERVYRRLDEMLYSAYQALTGFLFETWSGVEVSGEARRV